METKINIDQIVWALIKRLYRNQDRANTQDDVFCIVKAAIVFAVAKYDSTKKASLSTFIYTVASNQIKKLNRYEFYRRPIEVDNCDIAIDGDIPKIELDMTMRKILSRSDYLVYHAHFVMGFTLKEVAEKFQLTNYEAKKCLHRILSAYESQEQNQKISIFPL